jgi:hypothetical protein
MSEISGSYYAGYEDDCHGMLRSVVSKILFYISEGFTASIISVQRPRRQSCLALILSPGAGNALSGSK